MTISELIKIAENRLQALNNRLAVLLAEGDIAQADKIEIEIFETQATLDSLKVVV